MGALQAFDPEVHDVAAEVRTQTSGRGADLAIVAVADSGVIGSAFESLRPGGAVLLFAQTRLGEAIAEARPFGVDVTTGVEASVGYKDRARLEAFIAAVRNA